jgi:hypothetical protein
MHVKCICICMHVECEPFWETETCQTGENVVGPLEEAVQDLRRHHHLEGIDSTKLHFGRKTFRINFHPLILDKVPPINNTMEQ